VLEETLRRAGPAPVARIVAESGLDPHEAEEALLSLAESDRLVALGDSLDAGSQDLVADADTWKAHVTRLLDLLDRFHEDHPLRLGMPREELKSRLGLGGQLFSGLIERLSQEGELSAAKALVAREGWKPRLSAQQQSQVKSLLEAFRSAPYSPPSVKESIDYVGEGLFHYLLERGDLVKVSADVVFSQAAYDRMVDRIREVLAGGELLTIAEVRDLFGTSRKYVLALMEHLDSQGVTVRQGDVRRLVEH
jgi:selenocysteine-specific elongation factor